MAIGLVLAGLGCAESERAGGGHNSSAASSSAARDGAPGAASPASDQQPIAATSPTLPRSSVAVLNSEAAARVSILVGNAGAASSGPGGSGAAAPVNAAPPRLAEGDRAASYLVPVPPDLESYAVFDVPVVHVRLHGGDIELEYQLPALLVGNDQDLSFRGPSQPDPSGAYLLSGDSGQAKCQYLDDAFSCHETLSNIEIDRDKLQQEYAALPAPERAQHLAVTNVFSDDPIGVLRLAP